MTTSLRVLDGVDVERKRVLVRVALNVPMKHGHVTGDACIRHIAPTLQELADKRAIVIVLSHFGRPGGKIVAGYSLAPLHPPLEHCCDERLRSPRRTLETNSATSPMEAARSLSGSKDACCQSLRF